MTVDEMQKYRQALRTRAFFYARDSQLDPRASLEAKSLDGIGENGVFRGGEDEGAAFNAIRFTSHRFALYQTRRVG